MQPPFLGDTSKMLHHRASPLPVQCAHTFRSHGPGCHQSQPAGAMTGPGPHFHASYPVIRRVSTTLHDSCTRTRAASTTSGTPCRQPHHAARASHGGTASRWHCMHEVAHGRAPVHGGAASPPTYAALPACCYCCCCRRPAAAVAAGVSAAPCGPSAPAAPGRCC